MARSIVGVLALMLIWCPPAVAQKPHAHVVYVDIDLTNARELADRPLVAERAGAYAQLRVDLTKTLQSIPRLPCWELQALPSDPAQRPAAFHAIKVTFYITPSASLDTSELRAIVSLTAPGTPEEMELHSGELILLGAGGVERVVSQVWQDAYRDVAVNFRRQFPSAGTKTPDILQARRVPIAHGLIKPIDGGAFLPIDYIHFNTYPKAKFEIAFYEGKAAQPKVRITSQCQIDRTARFLRVVHELWDNTRRYEKAKDDATLNALTPASVFLKEFGDYENPPELDQ